MIQLTYQAALDPFHSILRLLRLRELLREVGELSVDHVRILDFYLVFPYRIAAIRLRTADRRYRKIAEAYASHAPYGQQPEDRVLFARMCPIQLAAMETLAARGYLDLARLRAAWTKPTDMVVPELLHDRVIALNSVDIALFDVLRGLATNYVVGGVNGLKHRTELMEHRYDAV